MQSHSAFKVAKRLSHFVRNSVITSVTFSRPSVESLAVTSSSSSKQRTSKKRERLPNARTLPKTPGVTSYPNDTPTERLLRRSGGFKDPAQCTQLDVKGDDRPERRGSHDTNWQGLSVGRRKRMRAVEHDLGGLIQKTIGSAIVSALGFPCDGLRLSLAIASAAGMAPPIATHAALIRATVASAQRKLPNLACGPDVAVEAFLRISSGSPPSVDAIAAVASLCAEDPVLERRAGRAASLLRYILAARVEMSQSTLRPIFDLFVSSLDMRSAANMLQFFDEVCTDVSLVDRAYWYDRLSYAALLLQNFDLAQLILQEKTDLGLPDTPFGKSVALSLHAEHDRRDLAESTANSMESCNIALQPFARAALIRAAGRTNDTQAMWRNFHAFETDLGGCPLRYANSLSIPARHSTATVNDYSEMTSRMQLADPTVAMFDALRMCNKGEDALGLVVRLREQYNIRFSKLIYEIVSQTCFRSNRLDLAVQFRKLLQTEKDQDKTLSGQGTDQ